MHDDETHGRFDVTALAASLPGAAATMLADHYMTDRPSGSARVFRAYRPVPPHFHRQCDEYLYVLSGRGTFWMGAAAAAAPFGPGQLLVFDRDTVHAMPELTEHPVVFLAIDTPRRAPDDVTFVDARDGDASSFMARNAEGRALPDAKDLDEAVSRRAPQGSGRPRRSEEPFASTRVPES